MASPFLMDIYIMADDDISGFLNIYKPLGVSSAGILNILKHKMGIKKIGHGGTLDPMAEGVLPVAIGKATRLLRFLPSDKKYTTSILLGKQSDTDDLEGNLIGEGATAPDIKLLTDVLNSQIGCIKQTVPAYSAVHVKGQRLYKMARQGKAPLELPVKEVHIYSLTLLDSKAIRYNGVNCWQLDLDIHCSAGTYIRSIARDIGQLLGCGGCMSALRRTWASGLDVQQAIKLEDLQSYGVGKYLVAPKEVVDLKMINIDSDIWYLLKTGRPICLSESDSQILGCLYENRLCAVIKPTINQGEWRSEVVIL